MSHILGCCTILEREERERERWREGGGIETVGQWPTYMCGALG
jgi:hypothetical protein